MDNKETIVFDFDGVIHSYISGWNETPQDPPVKHIKEEIDLIRKEGYEVVVVSTRCATKEGMDKVIEYLHIYDIRVVRVLATKPPALVYIDDRGVNFDGNAKSLLYKIKNFIPWTNNENLVKKFVGVELEENINSNISLKFHKNEKDSFKEETKEFLYKFVSVLDKDELAYFLEEVISYLDTGDNIKISHDEIIRLCMTSEEEDINISIDNRIKRKYGSL